MKSFTDAPGATLFAAAALMVALALAPASVEARSNETTNWSDEDYMLYPPFCRARLLREPKELEVFWSQRLGPKNFMHMHHFCFGLKALNLAYGSFQDKQRRANLAYSVVGNFNYILEHTERTFFMRPEALVNLARGHVLLQEYNVARKKFEEALKLNPKSVDAWVAFSDMYYEAGKREDALRILEMALEQAGEHKKITLRIDEMKGAKGSKVVKETKESKEPVEPKEPKEPKESMVPVEPKESMVPVEPEASAGKDGR